ncbi:hypothetical protein RD1_D0006 (plasmid) [Roseobacter denitrificans OCh 114]|uniref:Uncharacterized protein n=1 Tax=Roseobacter denitrificans (strain ATCC 33942 / OCh 114) TaxID=375451 RepID=Q07GB2_ROSDO|nr:hypothetical protein RD1_D0006 [Roseobacter denitrificans OCh 114]
MPDLCVIRFVERKRLPPVLGIVHPPGDLRDVVAHLVERTLHRMERLGQLGIRRGHTSHIPDDIAQRFTSVSNAGLFQLLIEQRQIRR